MKKKIHALIFVMIGIVVLAIGVVLFDAYLFFNLTADILPTITSTLSLFVLMVLYHVVSLRYLYLLAQHMNRLEKEIY